MTRCKNGTPKWTRPMIKGKDHQKRGRRGHTWIKKFGDILNDEGKVIGRIKIGRFCKNCGKEHIVPELR